MGKRITIELCLCDNAILAAQQYDVNIPQVAIEAIQLHLQMKQDISIHLDALSPTLENRALKELLKSALEELAIARNELRGMLLQREEKRSFIPLRTIRPIIQ